MRRTRLIERGIGLCEATLWGTRPGARATSLVAEPSTNGGPAPAENGVRQNGARPRTALPRVRVVVLNFNGGDHVLECLRRATETQWPAGKLELVVVDNGSSDGSVDRIRSEFPQLHVIDSPRNLGFGAGNNLALRDLDGVDYVALLNNDAFVDPGWLRPLIEAIECEDGVGAVSPKILLAPRFTEIELACDPFLPGGDDLRSLGVRVSGVWVGGQDRWNDTVFADGWFEVERGTPAEPTFRWCEPESRLWVPGVEGEMCSLRLTAEREKDLVLRSGTNRTVVRVGPEPRWIDVALAGSHFDVLNNTGSLLVEGGYGADRGFLERDHDQFAESGEVFAWCGCCVLLSKRYLEDVGLFDERFFLYYEDFDLSWRGRLRGWRYVYAPGSVVRHLHAASSVKGSSAFERFVERNRLLMLAKNAPAALVVRCVLLYARTLVGYVRRDVVGRLREGRRPAWNMVGSRLGALVWFSSRFPWILWARLRHGRPHRRDEILGWMVHR